MNLMDWVQIAILLLFILLFLKPLYGKRLPRYWNGFWNRLLPARALKSEGHWQRKSSKTGTKD